MSTIASASLLPLLATASAATPLSMIAARDAGIPVEDLVIFRTRLSEQVIGASSPFSDKVDQLADILASKGRGKAKQIPGAKIQLATAWNDLNPQLKLDAQIAAAQVTAQLTSPESMAEIAEADHGVIGPNGEGAQRFHEYDVRIVEAVKATGPLGMVAIAKLFREFSPSLTELPPPSPEYFEKLANIEREREESLRAAQFFFLSALLSSPEWDEKGYDGGTLTFDLTKCLMLAAECLYQAGRRRPANQYLDDVIDLRRVAVFLSGGAEKGPRLAALQEAVAESLEPRAEEARPSETQLITSALYLLDASANWNNAEESEAARRAFEKSVGLLQMAGRLPAQADAGIVEDN